MKMKNCLLLLEFGIPHYRYFLIDYFIQKFDDFFIIHNGLRFIQAPKYQNISKEAFNINLFNDVSLTLINPLKLLKYKIIISTFNIRKPHTWLFVLMFPWKKWILWSQGLGKSKSSIVLFVRKLVYSIAKGIVVYTQENKDQLVSIGIKKSKISVANNTLYISNSRQTSGYKYFIFVGRLTYRKEIDRVLFAIKETKLELLIVGEGEALNDLKMLVKKYQIEKFVKFVGPSYNDDELLEYFSNAIAYVSPAELGLSVIHSFAYGVPIITNKNRSQGPEFSYCNNGNSYIYSEDSELPRILLRAYNNKEENLLKRKNAYSDYINYYSPQNMIEAFNYHIEKIF